MNRCISLIGMVILLSFGGLRGCDIPDSPAATVRASPPLPLTSRMGGDTIRIDTARSVVGWKGTKMRGAGKHEGLVPLAEGFLIRQRGRLVGGTFILDMTGITVTDIPEHEPIPRQRLIDHLKSNDFFAVDSFPTAVFQLVEAETVAGDSLRITGNLTMRGITQQLTFGARQHVRPTRFTARFSIRRADWNIAYSGSWADRTLVDPDIGLSISCVVL